MDEPKDGYIIEMDGSVITFERYKIRDVRQCSQRLGNWQL